MPNIDRYMSRINERIMSCSQQALDNLSYALDDLNGIAEQNPDREDIRACIDDVKSKCKKALTESWAVANHWSEHFDGLSEDDTDKTEEEGDKAEQEETADDNGDDEE